MKKFVPLACIALVGVALTQRECPCWGKDPAPRQSSGKDEVARLAPLRQSAQAFREAFNRGDAKAVAALWTKDGEYIDESGGRFQGRDAIQKEYAQFFAAHPGEKMNVVIDSLRLINDDTAVEIGRASLSPPLPGAPASSRYTAIHVKSGGQWLMAFARDSREPAASAYDRLKDLEWLVGTWTAVEQADAGSIEMTCAWGPKKSTLEVTYSVNSPGGDEPADGKQIIAWDPDSGRIRSWSFSSDGGRSVGTWSEHDGAWSVAMQGVLPDGERTSSVITFTRMDDGAILWQSSANASGGMDLPDAGEVVLQRVGGE